MNNQVLSSHAPTIPPVVSKEPAISALSLARWRHDDAAINNLLHSGARIDLSALEPGTSLELHPCAPAIRGEFDPTSPHSGANETCLALEGDTGTLCIESAAQWIHALTNIPIDLKVVSAEQTWLLATAAALLPFPLQPMFNTLRRWQGAVPPTSTYKARLVLRTVDHVLTTHGYASAAVWERMFGTQTTTRRALEACPGWSSWIWQQPVVVGSHVLSKATLQKLQVGDIVMPERRLFDVNGRGRLPLGNLQLDIQNTLESELEVVGVYTNSDNQDTIDTASPTNHRADLLGKSAVTDAVGLSGIPMELQFELGVLKMSLGQMQSLDIGSILHLQAPAAPPQVRILVGGQSIGKGDLLDVDGQLGIQITHWAGA